MHQSIADLVGSASVVVTADAIVVIAVIVTLALPSDDAIDNDYLIYVHQNHATQSDVYH